MAFQIHITHLEQAIVCANEKISNYLTEAKGDIDPLYYKKFQALNNYLLLLYEIHGVRTSDVISFCTKIWRRAVDCHQELKSGGKLKCFITAANGCLVTIVKVIDALTILKGLWNNLELKMDDCKIRSGEDWTALDKLINEHVEDATERLEAVDTEVHITRQKIIDIKKPSIRIMEVAQMDVDGDMVYITDEKPKNNQAVDEEPAKSVSLVQNVVERSVKKSSTLELGEIVEDEESPIVPNIQESPKPAPVVTSVQSVTISPSVASVAKNSLHISSIQTNPSEVVPQPSVPITLQHETPAIQIAAPTTLTNNFQSAPSFTYPTMPTLPMQAQLIPTLQMDAFGNQSIVYQLTYQQVTPTMPTSLPTQSVSNSLNTPLAGIVIPAYPNNAPFHTSTHQNSPTLVTNTSQEIHPQQETNNDQVPFHYATLVDNLEDQVVVVKPEPDTNEKDVVKIKEEVDDEQEVQGSVIEIDSTYIKEEPEWNEDVDEK